MKKTSSPMLRTSPCQLLATLADLERQHVGVAEERDPVHALRDRLDHLQRASVLDATVSSDVDMIVQATTSGAAGARSPG